MDIEYFPPEVEPVISEPAPSRWEQWRARLQSYRAPALRVALFAPGVALTFADGTKSSAQITTSQPDHDIAVLRADQPPAKIVPATLGNPNGQRVGDEAFVVGNPFGLYGSMSAGVISGFDRSFQPVDSPY